MRGLRNLYTYGRFRQHHPDWPYVIGDILAVLLLFTYLLFLAGCQPKEEPLPPTVPPPEDLSFWTVPELVQPAHQHPKLQVAWPAKIPAGTNEKVYDYKPGVAVDAPVALGMPLDIVLEEGEQVRQIVDGDRAPTEQGQARRWEVREGGDGASKDLRPHVFVTASVPGMTNGITITTTRRTYYVTCKSVQKSPVRVLRWHYKPEYAGNPEPKPVEEQPGLLPHPEQPMRYHVGYEVSASQPTIPWVPRHVVDDGKKLYIVYPEVTLFESVPLLRIVGPNGPQLVNSRQFLNVVIVDQLVARAELRVGIGERAQIVTITRGNLRTVTCPGDEACPVWPKAAAVLAGR
jgi:type IV secretory pathway VirB9-like protein